MAFKFDSDVAHVQAFRAIVQKAKSLDEAVDTNRLTPDEAALALEDFISKNGVPDPSPKIKKLQADAKKVADAEKAAESAAAKVEADAEGPRTAAQKADDAKAAKWEKANA